MDGVATLRIAEVKPNPKQPRKTFDREPLEELAASIRQYGLLQPIVVRKRDGGWQIVAGERRWRASQLAGKETIRALVIKADDDLTAELALIENSARADLNHMEVAYALDGLHRRGLSAETIAGRVGKSTETIERHLSLLNLDPALQHLVARKQMPMALAVHVATLDRNRQIAAVNEASAKRYTTREALALVDVLKVEQAQEHNGELFKVQRITERHRAARDEYQRFMARAIKIAVEFHDDQLDVLVPALAADRALEVERLRTLERTLRRIREALERAAVDDARRRKSA